MWKWLTIAVLIYGLIAAGAIIAPRTMLTVAALDLAALGRDWRQAGPLVPFYDFEAPMPAPLSRPPGTAEVVPAAAGNRVLRWEPPRDAPLALVGLPLSAPEPPPAALTVRVRGEQLPRLVLGVREEDGSAYIIDVPVGPDWQAHVIPLSDLRPAPRSGDENGRLDVNQITAVFVARGEMPQPQMRRRGRRPDAVDQGLAVVELDDLGFAPPLDAAEPPGLDGPPSSGGSRERRPPEGQPPGDRQGPPPAGRRGPPPPEERGVPPA